MSTAEITTLTKQNQDLSHKVANLEQGISNAQKSLHRIEQGLFGDEEISHLGVIKELDKMRGYISDVEAKVEFMRIAKEKEDAVLKAKLKAHKWWVGVIAAIFGSGVATAINHFFNK